MTHVLKVLPILAGAAAGAIVALLIAPGSSTKTIVETGVPAATSSSGSGTAAHGIPTAVHSGGGMTVNQIYKQDSPGVVDITVVSTQGGGSNGFFSVPSQKTEDEGAGVVYDKQGDILTDEHVVAGAQSVTVHFQNGTHAAGKVLGTDSSTDVGVVKVNVPASGLHPIPFANSNEAQVGDPVVAIGSPFGLPETTTTGIVSAVGRTITAPNGFSISGAIQTDAAINPGNSGGPLLDARGQVLGLNDQIQTSSGDSAGVGFATPGNTDVQVANQIIAGKKVQHPYVGVCLTDAKNGGAQIVTHGGGSCSSDPVVAGSPAAKAGLEPGDVITKLDGKTITDADDFIAVVGAYKPGDTVTLTVQETGGKTAQVRVTLGDRPATAPTAS